MNKRTILALALSTIAVLTGCGTTAVMRPTAQEHIAALPKNCPIDVYLEASDVTRAYETVCLIHAETGRGMFDPKSTKAVLKKIKPKACKCGANAIIVQDMARHGAGFFDTGHGYSTAKVKAIRYTD